MKGKFIGDSIRTVEDSLEAIKDHLKDGLIVALDFTKAFDSVRWKLIIRALECHNFGDHFMDYIKLLFCDMESCLIHSGTTSPHFKPGRGIRQGCCVSPFIFLLVVELLSNLISKNENIKGIRMGQAEINIAQFADDMTVMLADESSLTELLRVLKEFETWSGLKINKNKTKIISSERIRNGNTSIEGIAITDRVKILGIWIGLHNSEENCYKWNYEAILEKIRQVCDKWYQRSLSLKGKITVINLVSLLQYPTSITHTPERVYKEYKQIITGFIWDPRKARIAYKTFTLPIEDGGLKLIDLETRVKVNLLQRVKRILTKPDTNVADSLRYLLGTEDLTKFLSYRSPPIPASLKNHKFYDYMMKIYQAVHNFEPENEQAIQSQMLWYNRRIGANNNRIFWPNWERTGISTIGDICHPSEGRLMSHQELQIKHGIECSSLQALTLRLHIPSEWRNMLTKDWQPLIQQEPPTSIRIGNEGPKDISSLSAKQMYQHLTTKPQPDCAAFNRWT